MSLPVWIYDIEVFKFDWIISFKNYQTKQIKTIHNDLGELFTFYKNEIEFQAILVGYNNRHYDDWILTGLLNFCDPFLLSDWIINQQQAPWNFPALRFKKNNVVSFDLSRELTGEYLSLKQLEGYYGFKIFESQIPFDLDRELTPDELKYVINYNIYDVECTEKIFSKFQGKFTAHLELTEKYNLPPRSLSETTPQKIVKILNAQKPEFYDTFTYELPEKIKHLFNPHDPVVQKFTTQTFFSDPSLNESFNFEWQMRDFEFSFGLGGGHGAIENFEYSGEIWNLDVASYYVSLMINFNLTPRSCFNGVEQLKNILEERIRLKNAGEKISADALKLVLVTIYGAMGQPLNNNMYDPKMRAAVCITGQLLLYLLQKQLEPYAKIVQVNTDGIMIIPNDKNKCVEIYKQWEADTNLQLELDTGVRIIQKNVNMYIYLKSLDFDKTDPAQCEKYVKTKGQYLRFWNSQIHLENSNLNASRALTNNFAVIDKAIVNYFIWNVSPEDTIYNCQDLVCFQKIVKLNAGFTNLSINDKNGDFIRLLTNNDIFNSEKQDNNLYRGRAFRVFCTKNGYNVKRYKVLENGEIKNDSVADLSNCVKIYLGNVSDLTINDIDLDHDWYIRFAKRKINAFLNKPIFSDDEI